MLDKYKGCFIGGAIGDALGAAVEFMDIDAINNQFGEAGISDYYPCYGKLGAITDDTQMLLFTAEGLLRGYVRRRERGIGGAEVAIVHASYLRWLQTQQFKYKDKACQSPDMGWLIKQPELWSSRAPGNTCINSLVSTISIGSAVINDSKGCGTVMRTAPVGLLYSGEQVYCLAKELSELTHGHSTASISAGALSLIICELKEGAALRPTVQIALDRVKEDEINLKVPQETSRAIELALSISKEDVTPTLAQVERLGAGWIAEEALAISIYCALVAKDFSHGVLLAVNHSGDSDSTGAITGNILGLMLGLSKIPKHWHEQVELRDVLETVAVDLIKIPAQYTMDGNDEFHRQVWLKYPGC